MALFVEASGYSKNDVDEAYQEGYEEGSGATLQGNATADVVLEGYTFSSRAVGPGVEGVMRNGGIINEVIPPGVEISRGPAFYPQVNVKASENFDRQSITSEQTDLGVANLVRYINAQPFGNARYSAGHTQGVADGRQAFIDDAKISGNATPFWTFSYKRTTENDLYPAWDDSYSITVPKTGILVFQYSAARRDALGSSDEPVIDLDVDKTSTEGSLVVLGAHAVLGYEQNFPAMYTLIRYYAVTAGTVIHASVSTQKTARTVGMIYQIYNDEMQ